MYSTVLNKIINSRNEIHYFPSPPPPIATLITVPIKRSATYFVDSIIMNETAKIMVGGGTQQQTTKWDILIRFFSSLQLVFVFFLIIVIIFIVIIIIINMRQRMQIKP